MYTIKINAPAKQAITAKEKLKEWGDAILFCNYVTTFTATEVRPTLIISV